MSYKWWIRWATHLCELNLVKINDIPGTKKCMVCRNIKLPNFHWWEFRSY